MFLGTMAWIDFLVTRDHLVGGYPICAESILDLGDMELINFGIAVHTVV